MNKTYDSYKLTEFNLKGHINLEAKCGLIKIMRTEDGLLVLVVDSAFGMIDQDNPSPSRHGSVDALLGFVLDIGVRREKRLTVNDGFYLGLPLIESRSTKVIEQAHYDGSLMEKIDASIQSYYQSGDRKKEAAAVKAAHLLETYNDARLLYPNFYSDSYLSMMRILDALFQDPVQARGANEFATKAAQVSHDFNLALYGKIAAIKTYAIRLTNAENIFNSCIMEAKRRNCACVSEMRNFDQSDRLVFACFYSAYQYRNKFVHWGLPYPDIVKGSWGLDTDSGTAYLHPALGISSIRIHRPEGLQADDYLDMHCIISDASQVKKFQTQYFTLIPTFHFLKCLTRLSLTDWILAMK